MTFEHTKGPWVVLDAAPDSPFRRHQIVSPAGDAELGNWMVAERVVWPSDAALIAAAPDMLAALKLIEPHLGKFGKSGEEMRKAAREAIAKASPVASAI